MDQIFATPPAMSAAAAATLFDAVTSTTAGVLYLAIAIAAVVWASRDERTRVFLAIAVTSAIAYAGPGLQYWFRISMISRPVLLPVFAAMAEGSLALFHFALVFPWKHRWLDRCREWLLGGYLVVPAAVIWLGFFVPAGLDAISPAYVAAWLLVGVPLLLGLGIVLPLIALLILYRNWVTARDFRIERARVPVLGVLISQLGGGVLAVLVSPLVHVVAPAGPWEALVAGALFGFGILMPLAFGAGVWRYRVLELDADPRSRTIPQTASP